MDKWNERVANSTALAELRVIQASVSAAIKNNPTPEQLDSLERLDLITQTLVGRIENADARLITPSILETIAAHASNVRTYLDNWKQGSGEEYLHVHAQNSGDNMLAQLPLIPTTPLEDANRVIKSLRGSVSGHRLAVDRAINQMEAELSQAQQVFLRQAETADEKVGELNKEVSNVSAKVQSLETATTTLATQQQSAFATAQTSRSEDFDQLVTEKQKLLNDTVEEMATEIKTSAKKIKDSIESESAAASKAKGRIEEILGIVGEEALIGSYSKSSNDDRRAADFWRWVTVGSIVAATIMAILAAISVFVAPSSDEPDWYKLVAKFLLALAFGALATYAGRQSSEHRRAQRDATHMATQLAAVKPYLQDMSDSVKRDELLKEIAVKLFGQPAEHRPSVRKKNAKKADETAIVSEALEIIRAITVKD